MSGHALSSGWLSSWAGNLSPLLSDLVAGFEAKHGFPPGPHEIRSAGEDDADAVSTLSDTGLPHADLLTFYEHIGEIDLADVGNGYWVHSAETVLDHLREYGPVGVDDGRDPSGLVIASDGGGLLFVIEPEPGVGVVASGRSCFGVSDLGPVSSSRVGQSVDLQEAVRGVRPRRQRVRGGEGRCASPKSPHGSEYA